MSMLSTLLNSLLDVDPPTVMLVATVFFFAGVIKGTVGFGMPLFAISVLSIFMPLTAAIAVNVGPSLMTNIRQAFRGPYLFMLLKRLWPFLIPAIGLIWLGLAIQVRVNPAIPGLALGVLAVCFALLSAFKLQLTLSEGNEKPVGAVVGVINGIVTGITGIFIIPGALYLQALGLKRDELVQAMGLLFMLSTAMIGGLFSFQALLTPSLVALSLLAIPSAFLGLWIGERLRHRFSEATFRTLFLLGIGTIGAALILRNGSALLGG